jgi:hypothetical protein
MWPILRVLSSYSLFKEAYVVIYGMMFMYQVPRPRSGAQMIIHGPDDSLYIYGGYSKEKMAGLANAGASSQKNEGKVHEDMWFINLKQVITADTTNKIGKHVDLLLNSFFFSIIVSSWCFVHSG